MIVIQVSISSKLEIRNIEIYTPEIPQCIPPRQYCQSEIHYKSPAQAHLTTCPSTEKVQISFLKRTLKTSTCCEERSKIITSFDNMSDRVGIIFFNLWFMV